MSTKLISLRVDSEVIEKYRGISPNRGDMARHLNEAIWEYIAKNYDKEKKRLKERL